MFFLFVCTVRTAHEERRNISNHQSSTVCEPHIRTVKRFLASAHFVDCESAQPRRKFLCWVRHGLNETVQRRNIHVSGKKSTRVPFQHETAGCFTRDTLWRAVPPVRRRESLLFSSDRTSPEQLQKIQRCASFQYPSAAPVHMYCI